MNVLKKIFGMNSYPNEVTNLFYRYIVLDTLILLTLTLNQTFLILYVLQFVDLVVLGLLISVWQITQFFFDYPSGGLGDKFGQKWVLSVSFLSFGFSFSIMILIPTIDGFIVAFLLFGFAQSQLSGALDSWFDNNYKVQIGDLDEDRSMYGFTSARIFSINQFTMFFAIILGGSLSLIYGRQFVISISGVLCFFMPFLLISLMSNPKNGENIPNITKNSSYFSIIKKGIVYSAKDKRLRYFILGSVCLYIAFSIWSLLYLFLVYFGYTGSDFGAGIVRSSTFITGGILAYIVAGFSKKLSMKKLPLVDIIFAILFFGGFSLLFYFNPWQNKLDWTGIAFMLLFFLIGDFLMPLAQILMKRTTIDLIPLDIRNSVYSLIPSITTILVAIILPITTFIIQKSNFAIGLLVSVFFTLLSSPFFWYSLKLENEDKIKS